MVAEWSKFISKFSSTSTWKEDGFHVIKEFNKSGILLHISELKSMSARWVTIAVVFLYCFSQRFALTYGQF